MVKVLTLQWNMRHDVPIVDHSHHLRKTVFDEHRKVLIAQSGTAKGVQFANKLILKMNLNRSCHGQSSSQATSKNHYLLVFVFCLQGIKLLVYLLRNCQEREIKSFVDLAVFASLVLHLIVGQVFYPIFNIDCSPEDDDDSIQGVAISHVGHDGGYFIFQIDHI